MKRKLTLKLVLSGLLVFCLLILAGCGGNNASQNVPEEEVFGLSKDNPLKVDKEKGTVTMLAQVNGKFFTKPTRHGAVYIDGSNGEKAIFRGLVDAETFHNALLEIGAQPGNNMTMDNKETTHVEGDRLKVTVNWEGADREYDINEVIKDSNGKPIDIHFGGNLEAAKDKKTGCLICLDSCPVGITSNATYTYGAVEGRNEVEFYGNGDILPEDGTLVTLTFTVQN